MIDIGNKVIKKAVKLGADQAEVFISSGNQNTFTIEKNAVTCTSGMEISGIGIRILKNNRMGFTYCTDLLKAEEAIKKALSLSKLGKEMPYFNFTSENKIRPIDNLFDKRIHDLGVEYGLQKSKEMIDSALEVNKKINVTNGYIIYGSSSFAIVNSQGVEIEDKGTTILGRVDTVMKDAGISTGFEEICSRMLDIDFDITGKNAAELAVNSHKPKKCEASGEMTILFTPYALRDMLEFITIPALHGDIAHKGESVYSDKVGELVASEDISIIDDATLPNGLNSAIVDDEGVPSKRVELIKAGVLKTFLYDVSTAKEYGKESTGSGSRSERLKVAKSYKSLPIIDARNLMLQGRTQPIDELVDDVKNGLLVYTVLGAHTANPASGDFSVNSSLLFKIEDGEIKHPIKSAMISGNMPNCLKNLVGMGNDFKKLTGEIMPISLMIPTIGVEKVRVSA